MKTVKIALLAVAGFSIAACVGSPGARSPGALAPIENPDVHVAAAVFGGLSATPEFTLQGVLTDTNGPVTGTLSVVARIEEAGSGTLFTSPAFNLEVTDGLFAATIPLPSAALVAGAGDLVVQLTDADLSVPVGGPIPMTFAPRAWGAEFARMADAANFANDAASAGHALTADEAQSLAGSGSIMLTPENGYSNYGSGYAPAQATKVGDMVYLSGLLSGSQLSVAMATLPPEYRPAARHIFSVNQHTSTARVDVLADGRIVTVTGNSLSWIPLDGICFPAP